MLATITQALPRLSPSERRVGQWILEHPKETANITLARLARECGTSEPTVVRFCRHVGLGGFRELAIRLTEALSSPATYVHRNVSPDDATADAVIKVMDASIQSLIEMRSQLSSMPIDEAVDAMKSARQIAFAGLGASGHVARDACHKFFRLGIPCTSLSDIPMILQFAAITQPDDVLVLLSHTGRWQDFARAAKLARDRGATVIALTNPDSTIARESTLLFPCQVIEDTSIYTPMSSRLAQLALLDAVQVALALAQGDTAGNNLRRSKDALKL
ncbi:MAG: SIS domain-containing protein [Gammaproteobacteria bacterium]|nr:SIS domain-containing protein [Gammaproteobacteria bacterium]MBU2677867.1 SIS domain-containing protein [Gammaproteobacteria bacterium]NNC56473.1 SIS domain-containing protein [Woeseiaceae bacterium]NNL51599.1 SIS domain-containing protein [Woeseiaceae bacterium]